MVQSLNAKTFTIFPLTFPSMYVTYERIGMGRHADFKITVSAADLSFTDNHSVNFWLNWDRISNNF